ncbi:GRIP and coiled-coil domain-containing protein 2-like [Limulus polyphemus]|uniref:GRIP and coiled-coil domain-containing protein 2-like n=1 Tax=Limulus polyphemus TaxID=6850 RepID=A0ABM1BS17_LIMPO|nr:GRIP and coiled-coil domain-containing protein 2-like [Limulus polyphemus]
MAESQKNGAQKPSGKVLLEEMSHEDLVKQCKKQLILLHKTKNKCDELTKTCKDLEKQRDDMLYKLRGENSESTSYVECRTQLENSDLQCKERNLVVEQEIKNVKEKLVEAVEEKHKLESKLLKLQSENEVAKKFCASSEEQVECLNMKLDTLTATCQCLQNEIVKLQEENRELREQASLLIEARDAAVSSLKTLHCSHSDATTSTPQLNDLEDIKNLHSEKTHLEQKNSELCQRNNNLQRDFDALNCEKENLKAEITAYKQSWEISQIECESLKLKLDEVQNEKEELVMVNNELCSVKELNNNLENRLADLLKEKETMSSELDEKTAKVNELQEQLQNLSSKLRDSTKACEAFEEEAKKQRLENINICTELDSIKKFDNNLNANMMESLMKIKDLESALSAAFQEKHNLVEELTHVKDLQRFVEDEAKEFELECEKLKIEIKSLEANLENDSLHISKLEKEIAAAEKREKESQLSFEKVQKQLEELEKNLVKGQTEYQEYEVRKTLEKELEKSTKLEKEKLELDKEVGMLSLYIDELKGENNELKSKCLHFQTLYNESQQESNHCTQCVAYEKQIEELSPNLSQLQETCNEYEKNKILIKSSLNSFFIDISNYLNYELQGNEQPYESEKDTFKMELSRLDFIKKAIQINYNRAEEFNIEKKEIQNQLIMQKERCDILHEEKNNLIEEKEKLENKYEDLCRICDELKKKLNVMERDSELNVNEIIKESTLLRGDSKVQASEAKQGTLVQLEEYSKMVKDLEIELSESKQKETRVNQLLTEKTDLLHKINKQLEEKDQDLISAVYKLKISEECIKNTDKELKESKEQCSELFNRNQNLTSQLEEHQDCLHFREKINDLTKNLQELENTNQHLQMHISSLNENLENKVKEIECVLHEKEELRQEKLSSLQQIEELKEEIQQLTINLVEVQQSLEKMNVAKSELEAKLNMVKVTTDREVQVEIYLENSEDIYKTNISLEKEIESLKLKFEAQVAKMKSLEEENADLQQHSYKLQDACNQAWEEEKTHLYTQLQQQINISDKYSKEKMDMFQTLEELKVKVIPQLEDEVKNLNSQLEKVKCDLTEVETEKCKLLEELNLLKTAPNSSQKTTGNQSTDTSIELCQRLKETEEKMAKFKAVAMKVKKELEETKKRLTGVTEERDMFQKKVESLTRETQELYENSRQAVLNFQSLQEEYDKLQDEHEVTKKSLKQAEQDVTSSVTELNKVREQVENVRLERDQIQKTADALQAQKKVLEQSKTNLEERIVVLEAEKNLELKKHETTKCDFKKQEEKIASLGKELETQKELCKVKVEKLEEELKEAKKNAHSLLDLEMADYERTISELNQQLKQMSTEKEEINEELVRLKEKISGLQGEIEHLDSQHQLEEARANNLKETLDRTKSELSAARNNETDLLHTEAKLKNHLESALQKSEELKVQLSENMLENQRLSDLLKVSKENHVKVVRSLENKVLLLQKDVKIAQEELETSRKEFESYKVRVHTVLKHQKQQVSPNENAKEQDIKRLEKTANHLGEKVEELSTQLKSVQLEYDALQKEHDRLLQRHGKIVEELRNKSQSWTQRQAKLANERDALQKERDELSFQLRCQNDALASLREQFMLTEKEFKIEIDTLQKQLENADREISRLQRDQQKSSSSMWSSQEESFDISSQERQEGEGSESTETEASGDMKASMKALSLATIPTGGFTPLEQLIYSRDGSETPTGLIFQHDSGAFSSTSNTAQKKLEHVTELLNDSEAHSLRLTEQVRVLKEEIRRLEKNREREEHIANMEYLKNVMIKFISLEMGSEKERLVPVLTTILKLSAEEQQQLYMVATGEAAISNSKKGWGNYLHRWSGML